MGTAGAGMMGRGMGAMGSMASGRGFVGQMASATPWIGQALGGAVGGIGSMYGQYAQQAGAIAGQYGRTGVAGAGNMGMGMKYGLGPGQMAGQMANYGAQTGLKGSALKGLSPDLLEMEKVRGFGSAGAVIGGAGAAGGRTGNAKKLLEDSIATGFQVGIRESRMDQFFMQMGGWVESMRNQGINLSTESANALVTVMGNMGLKGMAGVKAAQSTQGALSRVGKGGGPASAIGLRAAGMAGGGFGNKSYMQARIFAESEPQTVMNNLGTMLRDSGGATDAEGLALGMEQILGGLGIDFGGPQAYLTAAERIMGGGDLLSTDAGQAAAGVQAKGRSKGAAGAFAAPAHEARMGARRAGAGAKLASTQRKIDELEIRLAEKTLPAFSDAVFAAVGGLDDLVKAFSEGGMKGLNKKVAEMSVNAGTVVVNELGESFRDAVFGSDEDNKGGGPGTRKWGTKEADFEEKNQSMIARTVRAYQKGGAGAAMDVLQGGAEPVSPDLAKARAAYHARKTAEALEEDAAMSLPSDDQFTGPD